MRGYVCDRCRKVEPGQHNQRDGEWHPSGWMALMFQTRQIHLCNGCGLDLAEWIAAGGAP